MKVLKDILYKVAVEVIVGTTQVAVKDVTFDSRAVSKGSLFVAVKGVHVDGHQFIENAINAGATSVVCEEMPEKKHAQVTYVQVGQSESALAVIASNYYDNPSKELTLVGITGTNGKTTIATLLYKLFNKGGDKVGLLSTVKIMVDETEYMATHTTPDSVSINRYLRKMVDQGVSYCFMEVSSHGIHQKRTEGLQFAGGVFTNLTHDHLDYHETFAEYRDVKKVFFDQLPKESFALVNLDDKNGMVMVQNSAAKKYTYAMKSMADYKVRILENQFSGLLLNMNGSEVWVKLIGSFNAYNLLAIYAVAEQLGMDKLEALKLISELDSVAGRFQYFKSEKGIVAIVDYAHTPDALKNVLATINDIRTGNEQVITVVGCGGDRDKSKRPKMGYFASQLSTQVIFTSDNPRSEKPEEIIRDIESGVSAENYKKTISIIDREQAIKAASAMAQVGDILLIAGKGHESYQEINGVRTDFDDYQKVKSILTQLQK
ncbi:UDP-N-acetylmuramoyl-L-alanyl-D-glutamate--2,6-diaminopimelate ligase [Urechidicola sp. KH5]